MPIEKRKFITREEVQAEPDTLFVFGDNFVKEGYGGQAASMRGEPNAVGIATKVYPTNEPNAFLTDACMEAFVDHVEPSFKRLWQHLLRKGKVVWPVDGIGTGLADLENRAPKIWAELQRRIKILEELDARNAFELALDALTDDAVPACIDKVAKHCEVTIDDREQLSDWLQNRFYGQIPKKFEERA